MYTNTKSCFMPETNIVLYVHFTSKRNFFKFLKNWLFSCDLPPLNIVLWIKTAHLYWDGLQRVPSALLPWPHYILTIPQRGRFYYCPPPLIPEWNRAMFFCNLNMVRTSSTPREVLYPATPTNPSLGKCWRTWLWYHRIWEESALSSGWDKLFIVNLTVFWGRNPFEGKYQSLTTAYAFDFPLQTYYESKGRTSGFHGTSSSV